MTMYRATQSGVISFADGEEVTLSRDELVNGDTMPKRRLDYLVGRGFLIAPNVESATAAPGEKRTTKRA